jgi:signal transduction histidine kinase
VRAEGVGRYPEAVEAAVYFSCLEALQNVAKYAEASNVVVSLEQRDRTLSFTVSDDGCGFDPGAPAAGTGLQGIADRMDVLDGELSIFSLPGKGTTVAGRIPLAADVGVRG